MIWKKRCRCRQPPWVLHHCGRLPMLLHRVATRATMAITSNRVNFEVYFACNCNWQVISLFLLFPTFTLIPLWRSSWALGASQGLSATACVWTGEGEGIPPPARGTGVCVLPPLHHPRQEPVRTYIQQTFKYSGKYSYLVYMTTKPDTCY